MSTARGFIGAGDLYVARYNTAIGAFDPYKGPYESNKFEIKPTVELKEQISRGRNTYGQVIESVPIPGATEVTVDLTEVNRESLTIALLGIDSTFTTAPGTLTAATFTLIKGAWVDLNVTSIAAAGFLVKDSAGTITYVEGVDYAVNRRMGWLMLLTGSALETGVSVKVTGTYGATSGTKIRGAVNSQIRCKFRLDGVNFADGASVMVDVWEAVIAADSAFDFLASDFNTVSLPGKLKTPVGKTEPFEVRLLDAA